MYALGFAIAGLMVSAAAVGVGLFRATRTTRIGALK
jgi:hypothetical protein